MLWLSAFAVPVALAALLWALLPVPFSDRLASIPEDASRIDNIGPYNSIEKWAANGSQAGLHLLNPARVEYFRQRIRQDLQPPFRILDAGCGGGLVANKLALEPDFVIDGVDLSAQALQYARANAPSGVVSGKATFQNGSIYALPFQAATFDVAIVSDVLEHLNDIPKALQEIHRVLRPGGLVLFDTIDRSLISFVVAILGAEYIIGIIQRGSHDWRLFIRPEELATGLSSAGFSDFQHRAFEPSLGALWQLCLFSFGLLPVEDLSAGWTVGNANSALISYIGYARKTS